MAWYDEAVFYHIYPLGLTGAPKQNSYGEPEHRLNTLLPWIGHIRSIGCNALYIGPLFESVGHGYETTDYRKLDSRLGTNGDLKSFVANCHDQGVRVIFDGVFNHVGRDFFAFQDVKKNRENSRYRDWFCNVNFWGNNEYNDGFSYDNWGGYNLLVKLNQKNPEVVAYICDVVRFWVSEFDVDGIRLDAADVLDMDFMKALRGVANEVKPEFWLMGEVIHGEYSRWVNEGTLHSVTNYHLHKALYSGHNDHNYFEIAHTVKRLYDMGGRPGGLRLYNFSDNHDVERIYTKLNNKAHFTPVHILVYTLPGIPSVYYGSEFGIEGRKERFSDDSLRPALRLEDYKNALTDCPCTKLIAALGAVRQSEKALSYGDYKELILTNRLYAFSRSFEGRTVLVTVNNDDQDARADLPAGNAAAYAGALGGETVPVNGGRISVNVKANSGEIWIPACDGEPNDPCTVKTEEDRSYANIEHAEESDRQKDDIRQMQENVQTVEGIHSSDNLKTASVHRQDVMQAVPDEEQEPDTMQAEQDEAQEPDVMQTEPGEMQEPADTGTESGAGQSETCREDIVRKQPVKVPSSKSYEEMSVEELQQAVLEKMAKNGPVTDEMRRTVDENIWHDSLVNWVKSFR